MTSYEPTNLALDYPRSQRTMMLATGYTSLISFLFVVTAASLPIIIFYGLDFPIAVALAATVIGEIIFVALMLLACNLFSSSAHVKDVLGISFANVSLKKIGLGAGVGILLWLGLQGVALILSATGNEVGSSETSKQLTEGSGVLFYVVLLLAVPIIVPFVEEVVFRGIIMGFLLKGHNIASKKFFTAKTFFGPVLFSAFMFSIVHAQGFSALGDWFILVWILFVGLVLAALRLKTDSIFTTFAAHAFYNGATSIAVILTAV